MFFNKITKTIPVKIKGTQFNFYFNWRDYKLLRKRAKLNGLTMGNYIFEQFALALVGKNNNEK